MEHFANWPAETLLADEEIRDLRFPLGVMLQDASPYNNRWPSPHQRVVRLRVPEPRVEPRGEECLAGILKAIGASLPASVNRVGAPVQIFLYVIDDIDFDCRQPFLADILRELVTNAAVAMREQDYKRVDVYATQYRNRLFIQVADMGPGLPDGLAAWLTRHAKCVEPRNKSGLNNAIALVTRANGTLELVSSSSKGTRIGFSIPLTTDLPVRDARDRGW